YVQPVCHQLAPHGLIPLALLKRVAGAVAVFVKHQLRPRKLARDEVGYYSLLVLNRSVVPVKLLVNRYAAVPGNAEGGVILHVCHLQSLMIANILNNDPCLSESNCRLKIAPLATDMLYRC